MLIPSNTIVLGNGQIGRGLIVPGAVILGGGKVKPDYSPIDMTTEAPDPRIRYQCASSHAVYGQDGLIYFAGPDECPVEYINGIAVGRHEPEAQSTNYMCYQRDGYYNLYHCYAVKGQQSPDGLNNAVNIVTTTQTYGSSFCDVEYEGEATLSIISKFVRSESPWHLMQEGVAASEIVISPTDTTFSRKRRTYIAAKIQNRVRVGFSNYGTTTALEDSACSFQRQFEPGKIASSLIKENTVPTTRGASFLLVEMQGAAGIRVRYTTGEFDEYPATGEEWFPLPWSKKNWGSRYIPTIEYIL